MSWYSPLSKSSLADLIANPRKDLTADEIVQLAQNDIAVVSDAFWGDAAPEAYRLTQDIVAKLVQSRGLRDEWWFEISGDIRDELIEHGGQRVPPQYRAGAFASGPSFLGELTSSDQSLDTQPFSVDTFTQAYIEHRARLTARPGNRIWILDPTYSDHVNYSERASAGLFMAEEGGTPEAIAAAEMLDPGGTFISDPHAGVDADEFEIYRLIRRHGPAVVEASSRPTFGRWSDVNRWDGETTDRLT